MRRVIENFLQTTPKFRERKHKDAGIVHLLIQHNLDGHFPSSREHLIQMVKDYATADRIWRQTLELRPELRGKDYDQKYDRVQEHLKDLGYKNVGP